MYYLFISGGEIFVILVIVLMLFGSDKIPGIARELGKGMRQLKDATNDIKREITESAERQGLDKNFTSDIKKEIDSVAGSIKEDVDDLKESVKRKN
ncbi:MAG: twin-arginine translocase TatA/TatE family subunit [Flavobacteriales bacterium]|nr:MAG: twin-arginine translocase TatA/TatE family subunit [Flavobacteriales bacterium]PIE48524.1 MAG: twin-arginine translocase TatA/TatE family subunit [Flavobacteriales bacterium]